MPDPIITPQDQNAPPQQTVPLQQQAAPQQDNPPSGNVQQMPSAAPNVSAPQPQVQGPPPDVNTMHDTLFGKAAKMLLGHDTQYSVDANGKTVATAAPQKPGQFFRNLLAASILGGAAGADNPQHGFAGGVVQGGAAEIQDARKQDAQKRQQAQEQFENQNKANQEKRDQTGFETAEQLRKAQIAQANQETLKTNILTQGESFKNHQEVAAAGKTHFGDYDAAGIQPIFKDVPESEMQQTWQNRPGASAMDWEATGVKTVMKPDGTPSYEYTYSAYDPKGKIPVSQGTIDQWKKDGMDKYYPELFDMVKAGKELDASQYIELKRTDSQLYNNTLTRQKNDQDTAEGQARVHQANAAAARDWAEALKAKSESVLEKTASEQFNSALTELDNAGGDFSKLSPKSKMVIGESTSKLMPALSEEIKSAVANGDQDTANRLMGQLDSLRNLSVQALTSTPTAQNVVPQGTMMLNPQGQQVLVTPDKMAIAVKNGYKSVEQSAPTAPGPSLANESMGTVLGHAAVGGGKFIGKVSQKIGSALGGDESATDVKNPE